MILFRFRVKHMPRVWALQEASARAMEYGEVSFCELGDFKC